MAQLPLQHHDHPRSPEPPLLASWSGWHLSLGRGGAPSPRWQTQARQSQPAERALALTHQGSRAWAVPRSRLANVSCLTARATGGSVWEMGHKRMPHSSSQTKYNFQATCRQKWPPFLSQEGREGGENHRKNPKKLGQFKNLSRCLQQLARTVRTNSLFSLLFATTVSNFLQLIC